MSSNVEMLRCAERELKMRKSVYPRWVAQKRMSVVQSDFEIRTMEDVVEHFRKLVDAEQRDLFTGEGLS